MKTKFTLLLSLFFVFHFAKANEYDDCVVTLSLFAEPAKINNFDAAFPYLKDLRKECPDFHISIYQYGEKIYKDRVEKAIGAQKEIEFNEYKKLWEERLQNFPDQTPEGTMHATIAQVMFDNGIGSKKKQFEAFDKAYNSDKKNFTSPKSIYTYFSLAVELYDAKEKDIQEVFDLYDEIINKIEEEENLWAERITPLIEKQDNQQTLNTNEENLLKAGETNINSYSLVKGSVDGKLGILANCETLVPLYERDFEQNKNDMQWLKNVNTRLSSKECTDPILFKIAKALHELAPSAESAYSLGLQAEREGNLNSALEYYNQSADLFTDSGKKANTYYKIAEIHKKRGSLSNARNFYRKAIEVRPSFGRAYLQMAAMYSSSSDECGSSVFEKRAINWLAADLARTAARVDPSIAANANAAAESYMQRAPQKSDIFVESMAGKTVNFNCWVGGSVKVPNL